MAHSAAAAAAAKRNSETARRSGPGLDISFVLIAFASYQFCETQGKQIILSAIKLAVLVNCELRRTIAISLAAANRVPSRLFPGGSPRAGCPLDAAGKMPALRSGGSLAEDQRTLFY
jgi:hypothetical protein